jgi:hypothetical protein
VDVGYERAHLVTAQPEIPLAPKTNATFFDSAIMFFEEMGESLVLIGRRGHT